MQGLPLVGYDPWDPNAKFRAKGHVEGDKLRSGRRKHGPLRSRSPDWERERWEGTDPVIYVRQVEALRAGQQHSTQPAATNSAVSLPRGNKSRPATAGSLRKKV